MGEGVLADRAVVATSLQSPSLRRWGEHVHYRSVVQHGVLGPSRGKTVFLQKRPSTSDNRGVSVYEGGSVQAVTA